VELSLAPLTCPVGDVAGGASHVQRGVAATSFGHVEPHVVAAQAKVFVFAAGDRFQKLVCIGRLMGIMTLCAVARHVGLNTSMALAMLVTAKHRVLRCF